MEPPQGTPVRKRRRWLVIAIAVLALIFVGTWALWTPVDPRLIGEWQVMRADPDPSWPDYTFKVRADGLVDHVQLPSDQGRPGTGSTIYAEGPQRFIVSGDRFEVRDDGATGPMRLAIAVINLVHGRRPEVLAKGRIVSVDGERLVLAFDEWVELTFVRVEDGKLEERTRQRSSGQPMFASPPGN